MNPDLKPCSTFLPDLLVQGFRVVVFVLCLGRCVDWPINCPRRHRLGSLCLTNTDRTPEDTARYKADSNGLRSCCLLVATVVVLNFIFTADKQENLQRSVLRLVQISQVHLHFIFLAGVYVGHVELSH